MKTTKSSSASRRGFTLWIYVSILMIGAIGLAGVLSYSMTSSLRTARNNEYIATTYVAESLAEKVRGQIQWDNKNWQQTFVSGRITSDYLPTLLTSTDNSYFSNYGISVVNITNWHATAVPLDPPYTGWTNEGYKYQVIVLASNKVSPYHVPVRVGIEINLVSLSIFHNAAFWGGGMDLEINPGKDMIIGGTVYTGGNLWMQPNGVTLTFSNDIAAAYPAAPVV